MQAQEYERARAHTHILLCRSFHFPIEIQKLNKLTFSWQQSGATFCLEITQIKSSSAIIHSPIKVERWKRKFGYSHLSPQQEIINSQIRSILPHGNAHVLQSPSWEKCFSDLTDTVQRKTRLPWNETLKKKKKNNCAVRMTRAAWEPLMISLFLITV